ncbi:MAG: LacI family DNA-binding transcriptional regulator [Butyricicoccaceae bacterium]
MAVTSKQIAELAGVSRGTVDRALHNRGRVNPEVAERIRKIAKDLGYQPHPAGQALVLSNKEFKIGVYLHSLATPTMQLVLNGVHKAEEELKPYGVTVKIITNPNFDKVAEMQAIEDLLADGCQALAITPTTEEDVTKRVNQLAKDGIPIVTFNGDIPNSDRLCYVGMNNYQGGKMAGALMGYMLQNGGKVLPITAHLTNDAHYARGKGFVEVLEQDFPNIEILPLQGCFDRDEFAYEITKITLNNHPDLKGLYVAANGAHGAVRAIEEAGRNGMIRVFTFDINPPNVQDLKDGKVTLILDQHPEIEGYRPLHILYDYLAKGLKPERNEFTELSVITKYNLD